MNIRYVTSYVQASFGWLLDKDCRSAAAGTSLKVLRLPATFMAELVTWAWKMVNQSTIHLN